MSNFKKILVFGAGVMWGNQKDKLRKKYDVVALVDNDLKKHNSMIDDLKVISPSDLSNYNYEKILLLVEAKREVIKQLLELGVSKSDIIFGFENVKNITSIKILEDCSVEVEISTIKVLLKSKSDFIIFNEIFVMEDYQFDFPSEKMIIFDIGMNIGLASLFFAMKDNVKKIYSFEPFKETYNRALDNFNKNTDKTKTKIQAFNFGLAKSDANLEIIYNEQLSGGMNIFNNISTVGNKEEIEVRNVIDVFLPLFEKHSNDDIILKVDCEGAEYEIFDALAESGLLQKVKGCIVEFHGHRKEYLENIFSKNGFAYSSRYDNYLVEVGFIHAFKIA